jgi:CBS-domain-containing membrane protein
VGDEHLHAANGIAWGAAVSLAIGALLAGLGLHGPAVAAALSGFAMIFIAIAVVGMGRR